MERTGEKRKQIKHKKHKRKRHSSTSESETSSKEEWVEATPISNVQETNSKEEWAEPKPASNVQRDDWMNTSSFVPTLTKEEIRGRKRKKELQPLTTVEKPGQHDRELNPYWKDGGTGLPTSDSVKTSNVSLPEKSVGDGGLSWLRRAYQRVEEQAKEENKSIEEIAAARWGSLEKLQSLLKEAEEKAKANKCNDDRSNAKPWKTGSSWKKHKRSKEVYSSCNKLQENKDKNNYGGRNKVSENPFQRPSEMSEDQTKKRNFCWEGKTPKTEIKQNWLKKETTIDNSVKSSKNANEDHSKFPGQTDHPKEPVVECEILSDKEMNELSAKLIKAEMLGRREQVEQLKMKLDSARNARENAELGKSEEETVVLFKTNEEGFCQPLTSSHYDKETRKTEFREKKNKCRRKEEWLADNNNYSLKQMFEREKMTTSEDRNIEFVKLYAKSGADDDDDTGEFISDSIEEKSLAKQEQRDRNQAIQEHIRMSSSLEKCYYCLDSSYAKKHLIIAIGIKTYLTLPSTRSFTNGHCIIVPMPHTKSGTLLDEEVWEEIKIFQKGLTKMFEELGKVAIFLETSMYHRRHPHTIIECIPVPKEEGDMAPFYFKKAIMESETEWTHNKKLIDLYKKDLLHSVPKGLPYFCVQFGLEGGFAHVIEDEKLFPSYFGKEIIGGLLEMEPSQWRKPSKETAEDQRTKTSAFRQLWKHYDWTIKLKNS